MFGLIGVAMGTRKFVKRQKSRGLGTLSDKQRKDKLDIKIPPHIMRAIGPNSEKLSTEIGILVRHIPPVRVEKWSQIPYEPYIASMLGHLQVCFQDLCMQYPEMLCLHCSYARAYFKYIILTLRFEFVDSVHSSLKMTIISMQLYWQR